MLYAVICLDKPGSAEVRLANRAAHLEYAAKLPLVVGGPMLSDDGEGMVGSLLVLEAPDRASLDKTLAEDPYAKAGLFESVTVRPYKKVFPK
ncbi:Protein conserved in bacteria [uncultured Alphaproteobacteria bacterium]|uniref:Protein conserved in bacteria n=1 Tax=uncultured Alphaproteobacteria bacterium TaxID=91750 RepID=A0A212KDR8_9PROT|nr:Protein conserved in bacteria [uncultured Alphaproteobacteria bacterium]